MKYPAICSAHGTHFVITIGDIPEVITEAPTVDEALSKASDMLRITMSIYFTSKRPIPMPSEEQQNEYLVPLPLSVSAKVMLLNTMVDQKITRAELARRMGTTRQEIHRLIDPTHPTKTDRIEDAMTALGWEMSVVCKPASKRMA